MKIVGCWTLVFAIVATAVAAQEQARPLGWTDVAELAFVMTSGNSETESISLKNVAVRTMESSSFTIDVGALRAESTTRLAIGTPNRFVESKATSLTAESYHLRGRYDHVISDRRFWFVGGGWARNTFAGVDNRYSAMLGLGNVWFDDETSRFQTDYGLTFTRQEDTSGEKRDYAGLRVSWDYWRQLNEATEFGSVLVLDPNLDDTEDWRADFTNWVGVSMTEQLALRVSLQMLYDNVPSLGGLPLFDSSGSPTGDVVTAALDELDTLLTVGLIVNF